MNNKTVASLTPAAYNPRRINKDQLDKLGRSMRRFGDLSGIVKNLTTGNLVGGHQRVKHFNITWPIYIERSAIRYAKNRKEGLPVVVKSIGKPLDQVGTVSQGYIETPTFGRWTYREVRWPLATEKAANIAANAHGGDFDMQALAPMLKDLQAAGEDLSLTGLELQTIEKLTGVLDAIVEDEAPAKPAKPVTQLGDLWILGEHRLLCGDATRITSINRLMAGERATMIFTDPPWNVAIGKDSNPRHRRRKGLENDDLPAQQFAEFLKGLLGHAIGVLDGDLYCVMASREWPALDAALRAAGMHWGAVISWVKDSFVLGRGNYHRRYEPIWYGWREGARSSFCGARDQDDVWEIPRPKVSEEHPTMKPVQLVARAILNSSKRGEIVLDVCGGAGSTLLAAHQAGRRARVLELDPGYCDVMVQRWEKFTGQKARRA